MARRWLWLLLILVLAAGCGGRSVISDPTEVRKLHDQEKKEIAFWNSYSDEETRLLEQELIPAFEREHPDIRVKSQHFSTDLELKNTLITRASSSRGPDVVRMDMTWVPEFSRNGLLLPLSRFPGFGEIRSRFRPGDMDLGSSYQENFYSLPLNIYTKAAIFNRELLKQAGYSTPPDTMQEVLNIARQHKYTIGLGGYEVLCTLPYIYSLGGSFTDENFSRATGYLNGDGTVRAVEELLLLSKEKIIHFSVVTGGGDNWAGVQDGNILMMDEGPWFYSILNDTELSRALNRTIPVPFPRGNGLGSIVSGEHLVILKGSRLPDESWAFLKFMSGKEPQLVMSRTGMIPTNVEAFDALEIGRDSYIHPYQQAMKAAHPLPPVKNWSKIDETYTRYLQEIFLGQWTVKGGLDRAASEIDSLLAD